MAYPSELASIYDEISKDPRFDHMRGSGVHLVGGHGPLNAKLMLIGEAPGKMENARRIPFIGSAGANLIKILGHEEIDINEVFLTNVVKYWPWGNEKRANGELYKKTRTPTEDEIAASREYIGREIEAVNPDIIGLCGRTAVGCFFEQYNKIALYNGTLIEGRFVVLFHPAVLTYSPHRSNEVQRGYHKLAGYIKDREEAA